MNATVSDINWVRFKSLMLEARLLYLGSEV